MLERNALCYALMLLLAALCVTACQFVTGTKEASCLSSSAADVSGRKVCVTKKTVEWKPGDGDYAHAMWHLAYEDGTPVEKGTEVEVDTLQWILQVSDMPPIDMTYGEKIGDDGVLTFHSAWKDRRIECKIGGFVVAGRGYIGDGDVLEIEANKI